MMHRLQVRARHQPGRFSCCQISCSAKQRFSTVFPGEQYQAPRSWAERAYPRLIYYSRAEDGGQFAALEQPQIFAQELRAASSRCVEPEDADGFRGPCSHRSTRRLQDRRQLNAY